MKSAVCLLVPLSSARFLAVSRRNDTTRWGLPGGKVDPGETNLEAVMREVREELGLDLDHQALEPLYCDVCLGEKPSDTYWVTTYLWKRDPEPLEQEIKAEDGLTPAWMQESELSDPCKSPFAVYNQAVFGAYRKWVGQSR
jgi:8-oxo-dGTP pyrophosphatase MutT (NUDIX family)